MFKTISNTSPKGQRRNSPDTPSRLWSNTLLLRENERTCCCFERSNGHTLLLRENERTRYCFKKNTEHVLLLRYNSWIRVTASRERTDAYYCFERMNEHVLLLWDNGCSRVAVLRERAAKKLSSEYIFPGTIFWQKSDEGEVSVEGKMN